MHNDHRLWDCLVQLYWSEFEYKCDELTPGVGMDLYKFDGVTSGMAFFQP